MVGLRQLRMSILEGSINHAYNIKVKTHEIAILVTAYLVQYRLSELSSQNACKTETVGWRLNSKRKQNGIFFFVRYCMII